MQASALAVAVALVCAFFISRLPVATIGLALLRGVRSSVLPLIVLSLASSIKNVCEGLGTAPFLVAVLGESLSPLWFPAAIFVVAGMTSFATGTSFGTMAILIPIAAPIAFMLGGDSYGLVMSMSLAAVLDGAIFGDHCSPISDTTIMSSIASSCDHIHHVRTQFPYSLTVGIVALIGCYVPAALELNPLICILISSAALVVLFFVLGRRPVAPDATPAVTE